MTLEEIKAYKEKCIYMSESDFMDQIYALNRNTIDILNDVNYKMRFYKTKESIRWHSKIFKKYTVIKFLIDFYLDNK